MKNIFIKTLLLVILVSASSYGFPKGYVPQIGEVLHYKLFVMGMYVGDTQIKVEKKIKFEGKNCFYIINETKSTPEISKKFYPLHDIHIIYLDEKTLLPLKVIKKLNEGTYKNNVSLRFHRDKKEFFFKDLHNKKGKVI